MRTQKKDRKQVMQAYRARQSRQIIAITIALIAVSLPAVLYKRPDLVGEVSKSGLFAAQVAAIAAFLGFTTFNWRCPSCTKYLGHDIHRSRCARCGEKFN